MVKLDQVEVAAIGETQWTRTHSKIFAKFQTYKTTTSGRLRESVESVESVENKKRESTKT